MNPEPNKPDSAEVAHAPLWLIAVFSVVLYGAFVYLDRHGGDFDARVYAPFHDYAALEAAQPPKADGGSFDLGKAVYNKPTCVSCHQATGVGAPGQFPPLAGSDWVAEPEPGRVIRIVLNGLSGPIEIKGQAQNYPGAMVPWKDILTDEEIAAVITYVRQNKEWGNSASAVTPEQVKAVREKIKTRNQPFTPDELKKIAPGE